MIQETTTHYDILPQFNFEERDRVIADVLTHETECKLKEMIGEAMLELCDFKIGAEDTEFKENALGRAYRMGRLDMMKELLEASKNAKEQARTTAES